MLMKTQTCSSKWDFFYQIKACHKPNLFSISRYVKSFFYGAFFLFDFLKYIDTRFSVVSRFCLFSQSRYSIF